MTPPQDHARLMELVGRLREGQLNEANTQELEALLDRDPEALAYYVESIDLYTLLARQQGCMAQKVDSCIQDKRPVTPSARPRKMQLWFWLGCAACIGLAVGLLAGPWLLPDTDPPHRTDSDPTPGSIIAAGQEIATLSAASECQWASNQRPRYEGQRLGNESLHLLQGIATLRFDSHVRLILEGPARLDLLAVDQALLHAGKAVFSNVEDLDRFTLQTPFSQILDKGTEYAVSVNPSSQIVEVHVFDGRVLCKRTDANASHVKLDAGQARRFGVSHHDETIPLAPSRFIRTPMVGTAPRHTPQVIEWFAYHDGRLAGQNGGRGWAGPWVLPNKAQERPKTMQPHAQLNWPGHRTRPDEGSLLIQNVTALHRPLIRPIRMDQDATTYLSFLVHKKEIPPEERTGGWAFVTLHDPDKDKIAIGPTGRKGGPRVIHNGRITGATMRLQEGSTYLFACKILARRNKPDQVFVRIYHANEDIDAVEPPTWHIRTDPLLSDSVFDELNIYSRDCEPLRLTGIRIGPTWPSVTSEKKQGK